MAPKQHPYTVALTGGIASGKTLVSDMFASLGVTVIDTDVIAHEIVEPGEPALDEIVGVFGAGILSREGRLNRRELRSLIFADPRARTRLEGILHPRIRERVHADLAEVDADYCILVIPLLAGRDNAYGIDRILFVDVPAQTQIERLMARDGCSRQEAEQALAAQPGRERRLEIADDVLDNSGTPEQLEEKVIRLHRQYSQWATHRRHKR